MMERFVVNDEVFCPEVFYTRTFQIILCTSITLHFIFAKGPATNSHQY